MLCRVPVVTVTEQWMPFAVLKGPGFPALCDHFTEKLCERLDVDALRDLGGEASVGTGQVGYDLACGVYREVTPAATKSRHKCLFHLLAYSSLVSELGRLAGGHIQTLEQSAIRGDVRDLQWVVCLVIQAGEWNRSVHD